MDSIEGINLFLDFLDGVTWPFLADISLVNFPIVFDTRRNA